MTVSHIQTIRLRRVNDGLSLVIILLALYIFLLPLTLVSGLGAAVLSWWQRSKAVPPPVGLPAAELAAK